MFPLAFVAEWLQGHWWGFISRNYVVRPTFFLMNVFIALKGSHFWFLFHLTTKHLTADQFCFNQEALLSLTSKDIGNAVYFNCQLKLMDVNNRKEIIFAFCTTCTRMAEWKKSGSMNFYSSTSKVLIRISLCFWEYLCMVLLRCFTT